MTCPNGHDFDLRSFNFPEAAPVTVVEPINAECPVCSLPTTAPPGMYVSIEDQVVYTAPPDLSTR